MFEIRNCKYIGTNPELKDCTALCKLKDGKLKIQLDQKLEGKLMYLSFGWNKVDPKDWKLEPLEDSISNALSLVRQIYSERGLELSKLISENNNTFRDRTNNIQKICGSLTKHNFTDNKCTYCQKMED